MVARHSGSGGGDLTRTNTAYTVLTEKVMMLEDEIAEKDRTIAALAPRAVADSEPEPEPV